MRRWLTGPKPAWVCCGTRRPQRPGAPAVRGTLKQPVMLDGWHPAAAQNPLAHDRLMSLCREGGVGWLAQSPSEWSADERGVQVPSRDALALRRAVRFSGLARGVAAFA